MNASNQISVELRLQTDKMKQDLKKAGEDIKAGIKDTQASVTAPGSSGGRIKASDWVEQQRRIKQGAPPIIPPPKIPAGAAGSGGLAGGLAALGPVGIAIAAIGIELKALTTALNLMRKSADEAARLYAKALAGGAGMRFTAASDAFASALGVSESDVFKYADAVQYLNKRMGDAIQDVARMTPNVASVSWEFKAMRYQLDALLLSITNALAPELRRLASGFGEIFQSMRKATNQLGPFIKALWELTSIGKLGKLFKLLGIGSDGSPAGAPVSSAHRMPSSSWERMGLVLGNGGKDYAQKTAQNTARIANLIQQLVHVQNKPVKITGGVVGYSAA